MENSPSPLKPSIPWVEIPGGAVAMRDDRTKRQWTQNIDAFLMGRYPVTQSLYGQVMGPHPSGFIGERRPVESVSWSDAVAFCNALSKLHGLEACYTKDFENGTWDLDPRGQGYRLPSEAEWQYACQAGSTAIRYGELEDIAWYKENSGNTTHDVGLKAPNAWGLHDMLGNVWEWCSDRYDATVYGSYRVFRGGGWCDGPRSVMATTRRRSHPDKFKIDDLGFRIAQDLG